MKAKVIGTIKIQENGRVMVWAQPSDREAVLMALKELTQMDSGDDADAWREALDWPGW